MVKGLLKLLLAVLTALMCIGVVTIAVSALIISIKFTSACLANLFVGLGLTLIFVAVCIIINTIINAIEGDKKNEL